MTALSLPAGTTGVPATAAPPYLPHPLHSSARTWTETNCYVDLWVEVLHSLELDPVAAGAVTLSADFDGDQWTFLKHPPEDLFALYGVEVAELNVWRPLADHIADHLDRGRLLTLEVDSFWLPDTAGVSYRLQHTKTTIAVAEFAPTGRRLGYFHGAGFHHLQGDDLVGVLREQTGPDALAPYVEVVRLDRLHRDPERLLAAARALTAAHLARRPADNPVVRLGDRMLADLPWLTEQGMETFHSYAFATCRQCGATAELAAEFCEWLGERTGGGLTEAVAGFRSAAETAKSLQFQLARAVRGRSVDLAGTLEELAGSWARAVTVVAGLHAG